MPDITMCEGGLCPIKQGCHRYKAKPSEYLQSYFSRAPYDRKNPMSCEYFWPIKREAPDVPDK
jgi:hypothetical protein